MRNTKPQTNDEIRNALIKYEFRNEEERKVEEIKNTLAKCDGAQLVEYRVGDKVRHRMSKREMEVKGVYSYFLYLENGTYWEIGPRGNYEMIDRKSFGSVKEQETLRSKQMSMLAASWGQESVPQLADLQPSDYVLLNNDKIAKVIDLSSSYALVQNQDELEVYLIKGHQIVRKMEKNELENYDVDKSLAHSVDTWLERSLFLHPDGRRYYGSKQR